MDRKGLYRGYIGIMEKKMEATIWAVCNASKGLVMEPAFLHLVTILWVYCFFLGLGFRVPYYGYTVNSGGSLLCDCDVA